MMRQTVRERSCFPPSTFLQVREPRFLSFTRKRTGLIRPGILGAAPTSSPGRMSHLPSEMWQGGPHVSAQPDVNIRQHGWFCTSEPMSLPPMANCFFQMAWQKGIQRDRRLSRLRNYGQRKRKSSINAGGTGHRPNRVAPPKVSLGGTRALEASKEANSSCDQGSNKKSSSEEQSTARKEHNEGQGNEEPLVEELEEGEIEAESPSQSANVDTEKDLKQKENTDDEPMTWGVGHTIAASDLDSAEGVEQREIPDNGSLRSDDIHLKPPSLESRSENITIHRHVMDANCDSQFFNIRLHECMELANHVTEKDAQRSFATVCRMLERALNILSDLSKMVDLQEKALDFKFSEAVSKVFSGIQSAYMVQNATSGTEQGQNMEGFPSLLELASRSCSKLFTTKHIQELNSMMQNMRFHSQVEGSSNNQSLHSSQAWGASIKLEAVKSGDSKVDTGASAELNASEAVVGRKATHNLEHVRDGATVDMAPSSSTDKVLDMKSSGSACNMDSGSLEGVGLKTFQKSGICSDVGVHDPLIEASSYWGKFASKPLDLYTRLPSPTPLDNESPGSKLQAGPTEGITILTSCPLGQQTSAALDLLQTGSTCSILADEAHVSQMDATSSQTSTLHYVPKMFQDPMTEVSETSEVREASKRVKGHLKSRDPRRRLRGVCFAHSESCSQHSSPAEEQIREERKHEREVDLPDTLLKRPCLARENDSRIMLDHQLNTESFSKGPVSMDIDSLDSSQNDCNAPGNFGKTCGSTFSRDAMWSRKNAQNVQKILDLNLNCSDAASDSDFDVADKAIQTISVVLTKPIASLEHSKTRDPVKLRMKSRDPRRALLERGKAGVKKEDLPEVNDPTSEGGKTEAFPDPREDWAQTEAMLFASNCLVLDGHIEGKSGGDRNLIVPPPKSGTKKHKSPKPYSRRHREGIASWENIHLLEGLDDKQREAVYQERARRIDEQNHMLNSGKLCLVLDLDHTLLNSAKFSEVDKELEAILLARHKGDNEGLNKDLYRFPEIGMWTKLRPGVWNFLSRASQLYELHVYTMGNKAYAMEMAKLLDPTGTLFAGRVISRGIDGEGSDDNEVLPKSKDLDGVLGLESAVIIIDDSVQVWPHHRQNLLVVERYMYFPSSRRQFGLSGPSLLEIRHDERAADGMLASVLKVIEKIHHSFFSNKWLHEVDVRDILAVEKQSILAGCKIVFSRVYPQGESQPHLHPLWQTAEQFGAVCTTNIDDGVTHVVAISRGTDKVKWAMRTGRFSVCPSWLEASAVLYRRANEQDFPVPS